MKSLIILLSFYLAFTIADDQNYEFPVDPGLIYPARNSVPYSLEGLGHNQQFGVQDSQPTNYLYNWPFFNQDISSSSHGQPERAPEKFELDTSYHSTEPENLKHVYIFTTPEEPDEIPETRPIPPPPVHTKIIFIKAPSPPKPRVRIIPPREEKTVIYVLVKKPEDREIDISPPVTTEPPKPEVFFIHYKSRKNGSGIGPDGEYSPESRSFEREEEGAVRGSDGPDEDYKK